MTVDEDFHLAELEIPQPFPPRPAYRGLPGEETQPSDSPREQARFRWEPQQPTAGSFCVHGICELRPGDPLLIVELSIQASCMVPDEGGSLIDRDPQEPVESGLTAQQLIRFRLGEIRSEIQKELVARVDWLQGHINRSSAKDPDTTWIAERTLDEWSSYADLSSRRSGRRGRQADPSEWAKYAERYLVQIRAEGIRGAAKEIATSVWFLSLDGARWRIKELRRRAWIQASAGTWIEGPTLLTYRTEADVETNAKET